MNTIHSSQSQSGFSLVELLIVIIVIGILASITIVAYTGIQERAITATIQSDLRQASTQLELTRASEGNYPANQAEFDSMHSNLASRGITLLYSYDSNENTYCLTARAPEREGVPDFYISPETSSPTEGTCLGHEDEGGDEETSTIPQVVGVTSGSAYANQTFNVSLPSGSTGYLAAALNWGSPVATAPSGWSYYGSNDDIALWTASNQTNPGTSWRASSGHPTPVIVIGLDRAISVAQHTHDEYTKVSRSIITGQPALVFRFLSMDANTGGVPTPPAMHSRSVGSFYNMGLRYEAQETPGPTGTYNWSVSGSGYFGTSTTEVIAAP